MYFCGKKKNCSHNKKTLFVRRENSLNTCRRTKKGSIFKRSFFIVSHSFVYIFAIKTSTNFPIGVNLAKIYTRLKGERILCGPKLCEMMSSYSLFLFPIILEILEHRRNGVSYKNYNIRVQN
uniref:Uncharacterized protein n=1 Tax=Cacopsylla melanoneura TaxID=428564 RepID=A0A8D8QK90_9HEMI